MTKALAKIKPQDVSGTVLTDDDVNTLVSVGIIPKETPKDVVSFFAKTCATMQMSPFKRQIHLIKRQVKTKKRGPNGQIVESWEPRYSIQTGIDGLRSRADSTGRYAGNDDYRFDEGLTEYQMIESGRTEPETATVTVYKLVGGVRCPFAASARWKEYVPQDDKQAYMWRKMPYLMLGKTAEALALRKAFPNETQGLLVDEEMQHMPEQFEADAPQVPETPILHKRKPAAETPVEAVIVPEKAPVAPEKPAEPANVPAQAEENEWREVKVHYGKNNGKKLGDLDMNSVRFYVDKFEVQESYVKDGKTIPLKADNIAMQQRFRDALDEAAEELGFGDE